MVRKRSEEWKSPDDLDAGIVTEVGNPPKLAGGSDALI
jgi:hypothetical protein